MRIQLPTGATLTVSTYEYLFMLRDEDMDEFYQSCIADDLGVHINDPFSDKRYFGKIEIDDDEEPEEKE